MTSTLNENESVLQYTSNCAVATVTKRFTLPEVIKEIRKKIGENEKRRAMLKRSCFGRLLFNFHNEIAFSGHIVHLLLVRQVKYDNDEEIAVESKGKVTVFRPSDFKDITGLRMDGNLDLNTLVKVSSTSSLLRKKVFDNESLMLQDVEDAYKNLDAEVDDVTFVHLSLIYMLEVGLLGRTKKTHIDYNHLLLVDKSKEFNKYPWAYEHICSFTMQSLNNGIRAWTNTNSVRPGYTVIDFPYAF